MAPEIPFLGPSNDPFHGRANICPGVKKQPHQPQPAAPSHNFRNQPQPGKLVFTNLVFTNLVFTNLCFRMLGRSSALWVLRTPHLRGTPTPHLRMPHTRKKVCKNPHLSTLGSWLVVV